MARTSSAPSDSRCSDSCLRHRHGCADGLDGRGKSAGRCPGGHAADAHGGLDGALPASLQAEIAANDAAGLPGLGNGVTVPAGCDIATSLAPNGRARIEQERTVHRQLNQGQSPAWIAAANAQLQAYLQVAVQDYCASDQ
jgi:hypothetical protein